MRTENIEKALNALTRADNIATWMNYPFTINQNTYATDAHHIIRVPKVRIDNLSNIDSPKNTKVVLDLFDFEPKKIMTISLSDLKKAIDKIPLIDEVSTERIDFECVECYGSGEVEWSYSGHSGYFDCPLCNGTGEISKLNTEKTGRKVKKEGYFVDFKHSRMRSVSIEKLIEVSSYLGVDDIDLIHQTKPNQPIAFKIGVAVLVMMPILRTDAQNIVHCFEN